MIELADNFAIWRQKINLLAADLETGVVRISTDQVVTGAKSFLQPILAAGLTIPGAQGPVSISNSGTGHLVIGAPTNIMGALSVAGTGSFQSITASGGLAIAGVTTLSSSLNVSGAATLSALNAGATTLTGLTVAGDGSVRDILRIGNPGTGSQVSLSRSGAGVLESPDTLAGAGLISRGAGTITGNLLVGGTTTLTGAATFQASLSVAGNSVLTGDAGIGTAVQAGYALSVATKTILSSKTNTNVNNLTYGDASNIELRTLGNNVTNSPAMSFHRTSTGQAAAIRFEGLDDSGPIFRVTDSAGGSRRLGVQPQIFVSGQIAASLASTVSVEHGLGGRPQIFNARLRCISPNNGFAAGDEIDLGSEYQQSGSGNTIGVSATSCWASSTAYVFNRKDTRVAFSINASLLASSWRIIFTAIRYAI